MAAPTTQEFTVYLPEDVIEMLQRAARERRETPDTIVTEALRFSLQPVRQEALRRLKGQIQQHQAQSEPEIRAHLEARLSGAEQQRLSQILERNRTEELTMKEIGQTLDLSESRVSQMHSSIVQRLQTQLAERRPEFGT